jgi:hypothetical protein
VLRGLLIAAAIFFIFIFAMVWLGIITGLTVAMPVLTNFFPGQEVMTVIAMGNALFTISLPLLAIILLIVRVVFGRRIGKGWSTAMIVFWFINVFSLVSIGGTLAQEFMVEDHTEETLPAADFAAETVELTYYNWSGENTARVFIFDEEVELPGAMTRFNVQKSPDSEWHLKKIVEARGKRGADARNLANELPLDIQMSTGSLAIPQEIPFAELSKWRAQDARLEVQVPVGAYIKVGGEVVDAGDIRVDKYPEAIQLYLMDATGKLICQDCPADAQEIGQRELSEVTPVEQQQLAQYQDYQNIILRGNIKVTIEQGEVYDFRLTGAQANLDQMVTTLEDGILTVNGENVEAGSLMRLYLTLPNLQEVTLEQTNDVLIKGFSGESLSINASGNFALKTTVDVQELNLEAAAGVEVEFTGTAERLNAHLEAGSRLDTDRGTVKEATISASDGSKVKLGASTAIKEQNISENSSLRIVNSKD